MPKSPWSNRAGVVLPGCDAGLGNGTPGASGQGCAPGDGGPRHQHSGHLPLEHPLEKQPSEKYQSRWVRAPRAAALPTPSLFFPGFNRDLMIKFPLPGAGSSCARRSRRRQSFGQAETKVGWQWGGCESLRGQTPSQGSRKPFPGFPKRAPRCHFKAPSGALFWGVILGASGFLQGELPAEG